MMSKTEVKKMLDHAITQYARTIAPEDSAFWRKRIQRLKEELTWGRCHLLLLVCCWNAFLLLLSSSRYFFGFGTPSLEPFATALLHLPEFDSCEGLKDCGW